MFQNPFYCSDKVLCGKKRIYLSSISGSQERQGRNLEQTLHRNTACGWHPGLLPHVKQAFCHSPEPSVQVKMPTVVSVLLHHIIVPSRVCGGFVHSEGVTKVCPICPRFFILPSPARALLTLPTFYNQSLYLTFCFVQKTSFHPVLLLIAPTLIIYFKHFMRSSIEIV